MDTVVWTDIFSEVRRHAGFKTLVEKFGQLDYWRTTGNWGDYCRPVGMILSVSDISPTQQAPAPALDHTQIGV